MLLNPHRFGITVPAFEPSNVAGLIHWIDFSDLATVTKSGGIISAVTDKSASANHLAQVTSGNRPAYDISGFANGAAVITANQHLVLASGLVIPSDTTFFFVSKPVINNDIGFFYTNATALTAGGPRLAIYGENHLEYRSSQWLYDNGAGTGINKVQGTCITSSSTASQLIRLNGTTKTLSSNVAQTSWTSLYLGNTQTAPVSGCHLGEILVYNNKLSVPDYTAVEAYLKAKWGTP